MRQYLEATLTEKERIEVEFVEEELISVNINTIDIIDNRDWILAGFINYFVFNEVPTRLTSKRFQAQYNYRSATLQVFINGIKEKNITIHSSKEFSFPINTLTEDEIEICYVKE